MKSFVLVLIFHHHKKITFLIFSVGIIFHRQDVNKDSASVLVNERTLY